MENKQNVKQKSNLSVKLNPKELKDKNVKKVRIVIEYLLK